MTHASSGTANGGASDASPAADDVHAGGEHSAVREKARHITGRLSALPRLAAAGAARARNAVRHDSDAERDAQRREAALEAAESGARTDWAQVGIFSAGIAVGALIGAGAALLLAPATGFETRTRLAYKARRTSSRAAGRLEGLGEEARRSTQRGARRLNRAATAARWAAEDALERRRRERY
jgi:hypothetical protein